MNNKKTFYATQGYEIIPCHIVSKKYRDDRGIYAANSRRDRRRFLVAYETIDEARKKVVEYEKQIKEE